MDKQPFHILRETERNTATIQLITKNCHITESCAGQHIETLLKEGYIARAGEGYRITDTGKKLLAPHQAHFAVIMAAGGGNRLSPVTKSTPKPLVKVWGVPMIETMINALKQAGIDEIYVITGYKAEMFSYLPEKYTNLTLIHNGIYEGTNNSSTVYAASGLMKQGRNFYICESDQVVVDPSIIYRYVNQNQYMAKFLPGKTEEWTFGIDGDRITKIQIGGEDAFNMVGITFWQAEAGAYFAKVLEEMYAGSDAKMLHWDNILDMNLDKVFIGYQEVSPEQIFEIDTFAELQQADSSYLDYIE